MTDDEKAPAGQESGTGPRRIPQQEASEEEVSLQRTNGASPVANVSPDYTASLDFLQRFRPGGPWVITAIRPGHKGAPTQTFYAIRPGEMLDWLEKLGTNHNLYFSVNPTTRPMQKKASREDIKRVEWLHVDIDPRAGEDLAAERTRILERLTTKLPPGVPPPTCIVDSGGGFWGFWRLKEAIEIGGDVAKAEDAKLYNLQLEALFEADDCHNIDRIARLPGTVNWPNEEKRARGRSEALAKLVLFEADKVHDLALFEKAEPKAQAGPKVAAVEIDTASVQRFASVDDIPELRDARYAKCRAAIVYGHVPDDPDYGKPRDQKRSGPLFAVCCDMVRAGCTNEAIYAVITDPAFGVSASVLDKGSGAVAYAIRQIEQAHKEVTADAERFQVDDDGKPYKNLHNARLAVRRLGVTLEFDEFAERSLISGLPDFGPQLDDAAVTRLWLAVEEDFKLQFEKERFWSIVSDMARRNRRHPVREFIDGLRWDGAPRLDRWLSTYMGASETDYTRAVGALVLVAAVQRVRKPGCKFDEMVVLEGPQGGFKSTALKVLAIREDWFSDDLPLNAKTQVFIEQTVGKWIVEAGELKGMKKGDVESLKACLSRQRDRARMAWGRLPLERARQFVIVGTTNSERYLRDNTGNRRFWPVKVGAVNLNDLKRDREQLWAEAAQREAAGAPTRLDPTLYGAAAEEQEARREEDPFVQRLFDTLGDMEGKLRAEDAWTIVGVPEGHRTQDHNTRLGDALRELGWERERLRFKGKRGYCYVKGDGRARIEVVRHEGGKVTVHVGSSAEESAVRSAEDLFGGEGRPAREGGR